MGRDSLLNDHHIYAPTHPIITLIMVLHPNSSYIYIYICDRKIKRYPYQLVVFGGFNLFFEMENNPAMFETTNQ